MKVRGEGDVPKCLERDTYFDKLILKALGDHSQVERFISYELRRNSNLSRPEAIRCANDRRERDLMR